MVVPDLVLFFSPFSSLVHETAAFSLLNTAFKLQLLCIPWRLVQ